MLFSPKNLVLSGGGYKVKLYRAVAQALYEKNIINNIESISGSSGGAIYGLFLCLGMDHNEIKNIESSFTLETMAGFISFYQLRKLKNLVSVRLSLNFLNLFAVEILRFIRTGGLLELNGGVAFIKQVIKHRVGSSELTFRQLHILHTTFPDKYKDLYVTGTIIDLENLCYKTKYFSHINTPNMKIYEALDITVRIPVIFAPKKVNDNNPFTYWIDGGVSRNIPINPAVFNPRDTLVFCFKRAKNYWGNLPMLFVLRYFYTLFRIHDQIELSTISMVYPFCVCIDPKKMMALFDVPYADRETLMQDTRNTANVFLDKFICNSNEFSDKLDCLAQNIEVAQDKL